MSFPALSPTEKRRFLYKTVEQMRAAFWRGQHLNPDWPDFQNQCTMSISWVRWEAECRRHRLSEYADLPKRCNYGGATQAQEDMLKEFLTYLLSVKTTKTFADLM